MAIANNAVQNRNEVPYTAVVMVNTKDFARPGNPIGSVEDEIEGTPSILPLVSLTDQTGNAIGVPGNPLETTATLVANSITIGGISLEYGSNAIGSVILGAGSNTIGNVGVIGGINPAAGPVGDPIPSQASLTGFANSAGSMTAVSGSSPLPVFTDAIASAGPFIYTPNQIAPLNMNLSGELRVTANVATPVILSNSTANIGSVTVSNFPEFGNTTVTQTNAALLQATVANAPNFEVKVTGTASVGQYDGNGALIVNAGVIGTSGGSEGRTGSPVPTDGTYIAFANATGDLTGVSATNPLPVILENAFLTISNVSLTPNTTVLVNAVVSTLNPSYADGSIEGLSMDLNGNLRVINAGNTAVEGNVVVTSLPPISLANSANSIGSVTNNGTFSVQVSNTVNTVVLQSNAELLQATVASAPNFQVFVENFPATSNVVTVSNFPAIQNVALVGNGTVSVDVENTVNAIVESLPPVTVNGTVVVANSANFEVEVISAPPVTGNVGIIGTVPVAVLNTVNAVLTSNVTVNGLHFDSNNALLVNAGVISGSGSNPAAAPTGNTVPTDASYTGYEDGSGNLVGVSASAPLPTQDVNTQAPNGAGSAPPNATQLGWYNGDNFIAVGPYTEGLPVQNFDLSQGGIGVTYGQPTNAVQIGVVSGSVWDAVSSTNPLPVSLANANVSISATNPAAGPTGSAVPADASYTAFADSSGNLVGVSATAPFPVSGTQPFLNGSFASSGMALGYQNADGEMVATGIFGGLPVTIGLSTGDTIYGGSTAISSGNPLPITGTVTVEGGSSQSTQTYIVGYSVVDVYSNPLTGNAAYPQGACVGGVQNFNNFITGASGMLNSAVLAIGGPPPNCGFKCICWYSEPANTYTDFEIPVMYPSIGGYASYDIGSIFAIIDFDIPTVQIGNSTVFNVNNIQSGFNTIGAPVYPPPPTPTTLYAMLICEGTPTFDYTTQISLTLTVTPQ